LIADDDPVTRRMLEALLRKWGWEIEVASDGAEAWQALQREDAPRLAVLDWTMPTMDGIEVCRELRKRERQSYIYTLLLTAKQEKQEIVAGLEAGADDYLTKPFDPSELNARLRAGKRIVELQDQLLRAQKALREQATHDALTGVWNRGEILEVLRRELDRSHRSGTPVGVVMVDLDHFKNINDTYGHQAGDLVLSVTAQRMRSAIRAYDAIGRYGGEEFVIVAPGSDAQSMVDEAERLRALVSLEPVETPEGALSLTASFGVASSGESRETDPGSLLKAADAALYQAKQKGRNRVELAATPVKSGF
jgi:two-component system cell cycle response regulator